MKKLSSERAELFQLLQKGVLMKSLVYLLVVIVGTNAWGTIDSLGRVYVPRISNMQDAPDYTYNIFNSQTNYMKKYCLTRALYFDGISTSAVTRLQPVLSPYNIPSVGTIPLTYNMNLISRPDMVYNYTVSSIDNYSSTGVHEPSLTIDVSAMPRATADQRLELLTHVKLALLAITESLYTPYRAVISVVGLPSQVVIARPGFSLVHATTNWPYSASSPVIARYKNELLDVSCP